MGYVIEFYKEEKLLGTTPWDGDLEPGKLHAAAYMRIHTATHVAIIAEETRQIVWTHPSEPSEQASDSA